MKQHEHAFNDPWVEDHPLSVIQNGVAANLVSTAWRRFISEC